ncbi:MAG TPA: flagellar biosynthetic protein FliO [Actinomycetales bacterium]|nr:flagellar biosynthetic protein FliO [Actinomycetales bacterium]
MELAGLLLRVIVSLGLVLAVLWFAAKGLRSSQRRSRAGVDVDVLARQPLAQKSSLAVVRLGDRALVLGVTEGRVDLLHEAPLADVLIPLEQTSDADEVTHQAVLGQRALPSPSAAPTALSTKVSVPTRGALAGSALSPQTWRSAVQVLREKTVRK